MNLPEIFTTVYPELKNNMSGILTGQIITMNRGKTKQTGDRELCTIFGNVAVPEGTFKELHQYTMAGEVFSWGTKIEVFSETAIDRTDMWGNSVESFLTSQIWRV